MLVGLFMIIAFGIIVNELGSNPPADEEAVDAQSLLGENYYRVEGVDLDSARKQDRKVIACDDRGLGTAEAISQRDFDAIDSASRRRRPQYADSRQRPSARDTRRRRQSSYDPYTAAIENRRRETRRPVTQTPAQRDPVVQLPEMRQPAAPARKIYYKVKPYQNLTLIAKKMYGSSNGHLWRKIAAANPGKVRSNGAVRAGEKLVIPNLPQLLTARRPRTRDGATSRRYTARDVAREYDSARRRSTTESRRRSGLVRYHTVRRYDNLSRISRKYYKSDSRAMLRKIQKANKDKLPRINSVLKVGTRLRIPS